MHLTNCVVKTSPVPFSTSFLRVETLCSAGNKSAAKSSLIWLALSHGYKGGRYTVALQVNLVHSVTIYLPAFMCCIWNASYYILLYASCSVVIRTFCIMTILYYSWRGKIYNLIITKSKTKHLHDVFEMKLHLLVPSG